MHDCCIRVTALLECFKWTLNKSYSWTGGMASTILSMPSICTAKLLFWYELTYLPCIILYFFRLGTILGTILIFNKSFLWNGLLLWLEIPYMQKFIARRSKTDHDGESLPVHLSWYQYMSFAVLGSAFGTIIFFMN